MGPTIELGPELPLAVYTAAEVWHPEPIRAIAVYCSDGRWGEAFDEFCAKHLHLSRYDRLAVPGGPAWLIPRDNNPRQLYQAAWEQLDLLVRVHELQRIVLITHYCCAYYGALLQRGPEDCLPAQVEEVGTAVETLRRWYPAIQVDGYLAMRIGYRLSFHPLADVGR